jgi:hypothetical protein
MAAALSSVLVACGGGGDAGSDPPLSPPANIDLTALNRDSVGHASAVAVLALGPVGAVPLNSSAAAVTQARGLAAPTSSPMYNGTAPVSGWLRRFLPTLLQPTPGASNRTTGSMAQPSAVLPPLTEPCAISGTTTGTYDDRDNNTAVSVGDVLTFVFAACVDRPGETLDGTLSSTYTQISQTPILAIRARIVMGQLSDAASQHALTLDGALLLDYSAPSATLENLRLSADGVVQARVTTHVFTDAVRLQNGYTAQLAIDSSIAPPAGGSTFGRTISSVSGSLESTAAGGIVEISTPAGTPLIQYADDLYPRAGTVQVKGRKGTLVMTALSAEQVQVRLDVDGDGIDDSTETVAWDWLL